MSADRIPIQLAALCISYRARIDDLDPEDVANMRTQAEELLETDDPLLREVTAFVVGYELAFRDPPRLAELGEELRRAVEIDARPDPVDAHRRDIHG